MTHANGEALVSVVIPCYQSATHLQETLDSVVRQSYSRIEVVVVDDGSVDRTIALLESWKPPFPLRLVKNAHQGASAARNCGTRLAEGEYILYLDSDDLVSPEAVKDRVRALEETGADVAYSDWQYLDEDSSGSFEPGKIVRRRIEEADADLESALFASFWAPPAALLYGRRIVERIGGWRTNLPIIQDARFLLDAGLAKGRFVHVEGVSAFYRVSRAPSLSRQNPSAFVTDVVTNAKEVYEIWSGLNALTEKRKKSVMDSYEYATREYFDMGDPRYAEVFDHMKRIGLRRRLNYVHAAAFASRWLGMKRAKNLLGVLRGVKDRAGIRAIGGRVA